MATGAQDVQAAQRLRHRMFSGARAAEAGALDADGFDPKCQHVLVEDTDTGAILACFRFLHLNTGADLGISYSAQFYDLNNLRSYRDPMLEIGRFCTAEGVNDPDVIRLGWAMLTRYVDAHSIGMMFGCSSFPGNDTKPYSAALALLHKRHLAPAHWAPRPKAPETRPLVSDDCTGLGAGRKPVPSLLRTYLGMGGWVSDHAVIDRALGTFHVFTGVEIAKIPQRRAELLRADAR